MTKKVHNEDQYDSPPAALWAMISDKAYTESKYAALGAGNFQWLDHQSSEDSLTVSTVREVEANLPGFAKKTVGEKAVVTQTETWTKSGDTMTCDLKIAAKGAPGGTTGTLSIKPSGSGSVWATDMEVHIPIPLMGGKLEGVTLDETKSSLVKEYAFNKEWLASH